MEDQEKETLDAMGAEPGQRLACQCRVHGDVEIEKVDVNIIEEDPEFGVFTIEDKIKMVDDETSDNHKSDSFIDRETVLN